uniref:Uncharacterized protein n=1 Tax=Anguilla anguilla TaxID=7936 RepID=A0A0E9PMP4_ANGAN
MTTSMVIVMCCWEQRAQDYRLVWELPSESCHCTFKCALVCTCGLFLFHVTLYSSVKKKVEDSIFQLLYFHKT